jgi:signal transduction histidine kinase/DNA-binding NarL/FixJ family response regulator
MLDFFGQPYVLAFSSLVSSSDLLWAFGLLLALAVTLRQAACTRRARQSAIRDNAARAQFLSNMSHEIRTPLNGIVGIAELLAKTPLTEEQRDLTAVLKSSSECLVRVVNGIFDFSGIESGKVFLEVVEFDLRAVIQGVVELFAPQALTKGLELRSAIREDIPAMVMGDPARIRQILVNLVENALKFTAAGSVRVEVSRTGDRPENHGLLFRVIDTGIGVERQAADKIFRPFTQANSSASRRYGGVGLGLAISHRLVAFMGGTIDVESRPGSGSNFWFLLPLVQAEKPSAAIAPGERILIVDDNPVNQIVALRSVNNLGYCAEVVAGGEEALEAVDRAPFAAILMDCQMPGIDGYEATMQIRRREAQPGSGRHTPIIAMTASVTEGDPERCRAAGMDDYLTKPLRMATLSLTLERWIRRPATANVRSANPVPASPTRPGPANGHLPIPLPEVSLRGRTQASAGWRGFVHSRLHSESPRDANPPRQIGSPTGAGNSA